MSAHAAVCSTPLRAAQCSTMQRNALMSIRAIVETQLGGLLRRNKIYY
jgi:hypothetical protein